MKKWWMAAVVAAMLLSACGEGQQQQTNASEQSMDITYTGSFTHEMEGVHAVMDSYRVYTLDALTTAQQQNGIEKGERVLEAVLTVQNDTATPIYFSPDVFLTTEGKQFSNEAERLALAEAITSSVIAPDESASFTLAYRLPKDVTAATMQIPVAFTAAHSTSSGDALGDIGEWKLSLNESMGDNTH